MLPEAFPPTERIDLGPDSVALAFYDKMFRGFENPEIARSIDKDHEYDTEEKRAAARARQLEGFMRFRANVLATVPYYEEAQLTGQFALSSEDIIKLVESGILFCFTDHDERLFPSFQFDPETDQPYPVVQSVNKLINAKPDSWGAILWWSSHNEGLESIPMNIVADRSLHSMLLERVTEFVAEDQSY